MEKQAPNQKSTLLRVSIDEAERLCNEEGYDITVNDIKRIFDSSDSWVEKYWVPFVSHIFYPHDNAKLWFCRDELWKRYEENAVAFSQQHPSFSIVDYTFPKEYKKTLVRASKKRATMPWSREKLPRDENGDYIVGMSVRRYQEKIAAALDEGENLKIVGRSREAVLRWLYRMRAIKITIFGKVFWVLRKETQTT